jgi:hypothetical protein
MDQVGPWMMGGGGGAIGQPNGGWSGSLGSATQPLPQPEGIGIPGQEKTQTPIGSQFPGNTAWMPPMTGIGGGVVKPVTPLGGTDVTTLPPTTRPGPGGLQPPPMYGTGGGGERPITPLGGTESTTMLPYGATKKPMGAAGKIGGMIPFVQQGRYPTGRRK